MEDGSRERQQPLLRSINNVHRSFVKFVNRTLHNVVLYWIDYQGQAVSYGALSPGDCLDIDTFVTHPWIFVDQETRDRQARRRETLQKFQILQTIVIVVGGCLVSRFLLLTLRGGGIVSQDQSNIVFPSLFFVRGRRKKKFRTLCAPISQARFDAATIFIYLRSTLEIKYRIDC